jgi:ABC-type transporter Mla MlaB component
MQMTDWPRTIVFVFDGRVDREDVPSIWRRAAALLEGSGAEVALCDVGALAADAATIDALARVQLAARRLGRDVCLCDVSDDLRQLLTFAGLADVLGVEPVGQPEQREERLGVEEEGELADPPG